MRNHDNSLSRILVNEDFSSEIIRSQTPNLETITYRFPKKKESSSYQAGATCVFRGCPEETFPRLHPGHDKRRSKRFGGQAVQRYSKIFEAWTWYVGHLIPFKHLNRKDERTEKILIQGKRAWIASLWQGFSRIQPSVCNEGVEAPWHCYCDFLQGLPLQPTDYIRLHIAAVSGLGWLGILASHCDWYYHCPNCCETLAVTESWCSGRAKPWV